MEALERSAASATFSAVLKVEPESVLYCKYKSEPVLLPETTLPQLSAANERVVLPSLADTVFVSTDSSVRLIRSRFVSDPDI